MFSLLVEIKRKLAKAIQLLIFHVSEVAEPWQNLSEFSYLFVSEYVTCYFFNLCTSPLNSNVTHWDETPGITLINVFTTPGITLTNVFTTASG